MSSNVIETHKVEETGVLADHRIFAVVYGDYLGIESINLYLLEELKRLKMLPLETVGWQPLTIAQLDL